MAAKNATEDVRKSDLVALGAVIDGKLTLVIKDGAMFDIAIDGKVQAPRYRVARLERLLRLVDAECAELTRDEVPVDGAAAGVTHRRIEVGHLAERTLGRLTA